MKILKKAIIIILAVGMLLQITACSNNKLLEGKEVEVNISDEEYDKMLSDYNVMYSEKMGEEEFKKMCAEDDTIIPSIEDSVMQSLILDKIFLKLADEDKIEVSENEITSGLIKIKQNFQTTEEYQTEYLDKYGLTEEYVRERIIMNTKVQKYLQAKQEELFKDNPSKKQLEEIYDKNPVAYNTIRASHILVDTEEKAKDVLKQLQEGKDFAELAKEVSTCPSAENGGDLSYFTYAQMVPEFSEAAFKLKVGEVTNEPVKTEYGYHIIKVTEIKDSYKEVDETTLINAYRSELYTEFINNYFTKAKVNASERLIKIRDRVIERLNNAIADSNSEK